jgi:hypothetical protein
MTAFIELDIEAETVSDAAIELVNKEFPGLVDHSFDIKIIAFNNID